MLEDFQKIYYPFAGLYLVPRHIPVTRFRNEPTHYTMTML
jgi:hypothetical protein